MKLVASALNIPLKISFKHAAHERSVGSSVWVEVSDDSARGFGEGCPREYVTGESQFEALAWIDSQRNIFENMNSLADIQKYLVNNSTDIDRHPSAFCAVELALLDWLGRKQQLPVELILGQTYPPQGPFQYTAVLGDGTRSVFEKTALKYLAIGFSDFKVKISGNLQEDRDRLLWILQQNAKTTHSPLRLRIDANNLWQDYKDAFFYLTQLSIPLLGIEEPLSSKNPQEMSRLSIETGYGIILDECLLTQQDVSVFGSLPGKWIGNIRISKNGGILRSLAIANQLKERQMGIIIGAQVGETSILSRAALLVASAFRGQILAQEGAYGTLLLEQDLVQPSLIFGPRGILDWTQLNQDSESQIESLGWGLHKNISMEHERNLYFKQEN